MKHIPIRCALLSVSDKTGIVEFAKSLIHQGVDIISTGGTSKILCDANIPHRQVEEVTGLPEMLDGRVKTLHPKIHGGILGRRDDHAMEAVQHQIHWIDLVVVNFYPFAAAVNDKKDISWEDVVEYIDIGGPTMVRAAAKNFAWVGVVVDPKDYAQITTEIESSNGLGISTRKNLAEKAFALTAHYDGMIHQYFLQREENQRECPPYVDLQLEKLAELRYGENPHQKACAYQFKQHQQGVLSAAQHQGKPLSYNNILDTEAAWACVGEFSDPACVVVKHANPCGVATSATIDDAYTLAYQADSQSAFGGIIALNRPCTKAIAEAIANIFVEVIIAPAYTQEALTILGSKPALRVLEMLVQRDQRWEMKFITGGILMQEKDVQVILASDLKVVTSMKPNQEDIDAMLFAWRVLKHIKSNGILLAKQNATVGIGAGQVSRIDAVDLAVRKAGERIQNTVLASDAFFPFRDSIDRLGGTGVRAIIQPGGSMRDEEVIAACNEHKIAMVFTGKRCFRH
ncbi:MAG: bifunctional phosphoribosylaminoimidazolecarboxamide formyltransferase/IMP cyclohydrolase [Gammaproteobacteria bacterium]|nr:bifunctional phosphoribosylaminoimidazolecarboxamide formyltransferase/IMP cyclohydrolase [Gammaproteobacteria bacterium]MCW5583424.1 bifunctional phosphoribosylaminoimidazolecarboxamide formyltransferase/IMP cyclohydrolase [Gammaproteobacteria bacterium]